MAHRYGWNTDRLGNLDPYGACFLGLCRRPDEEEAVCVGRMRLVAKLVAALFTCFSLRLLSATFLFLTIWRCGEMAACGRVYRIEV